MKNDMLDPTTGLPKELIFCKKCVISNQRPTTTLEVEHGPGHKKPTTVFGDDGICDACRWAELKETINWAEREKELIELLDRHRSRDGSFDVIVPASGGKDSGYVAHVLKHRYGMHPLLVTWAPHLWTDIGWLNWQNLLGSGFNSMLFTPNGVLHRMLTRLAFVNLGHPFQPFILGQRGVAPKVALSHGVKLIFYGENVAEYGNRMEDNYNPKMDPSLYTSVDIDNPDLLIGGVSIDELKKRHQVTRHDLQLYGGASMESVVKAEIEVHYMSYYRKWVPQDNYYYAVENTGFVPNEERSQGSYSKYSGIDDKVEDFHYYMAMIKFGMGRATWDAAQEIRSLKIDRTEGVALVRKYDTEFPMRFFNDFLTYIAINEEQFHEVVDRYRSPHLWKNDGGEWVLRNPVR